MTPAIRLLEQQAIPHRVLRYEAKQGKEGWGRQAATRLGLDSARVFKTLVARLDGGELAVALVPVDARLDLKKLARSLGARRAEMADPAEVQRSSGYLPGGVSPLAQKKPLKTCIDLSARDGESLFVSAGRRGLEVELSTEDLLRLTQGEYADIAAGN